MNCIADHLPSDQKIDAASKADFITKFITCAQAIWMVVQVITRDAQKLPISLLEVLASGFVAMTVPTYLFWYQKPYNIPFAKCRVSEDIIDAVSDSSVEYYLELDHYHWRKYGPLDAS